jgi:hypothetical protein
LTALFLALLVLAWVGMLLPSALRARRRSPLGSTEGFRKKMDVIAPRSPGGRWVVMPQSPDRLERAAARKSRRRRRQLLALLLAAAVASGIAAVALGGAVWFIHAACDAALAAYAGVLRRAKTRSAQGAATVRTIGVPERPAEASSRDDPLRAGGTQA